MRWDDNHESPDVIDRRGERGPALGGAGLGGLLTFLPLLIRSPIGWVVLLALGAFWFFSGGLGGGGEAQRPADARSRPAATAAAPAGEDKMKSFVSFVFDDVQKTWEREFAESGKPYRRSKLVLFSNATQTACGAGRSATGPFYCPADERAYIDLSFYRELSGRFGAKGDFAQAYVLAHEVGHHVQNLLGTNDRVGRARGDQQGANSAAVRLELQADCYAGVWAHSTGQRKLLESGDVEEALGAATAIGDDRLQRQSGGTVSPETWTHGSSQQRVRWFRQGYEKGDPSACDTFAANILLASPRGAHAARQSAPKAPDPGAFFLSGRLIRYGQRSAPPKKKSPAARPGSRGPRRAGRGPPERQPRPGRRAPSTSARGPSPRRTVAVQPPPVVVGVQLGGSLAGKLSSDASSTGSGTSPRFGGTSGMPPRWAGVFGC
jgi:predicted metalloprotease